VKRSAIPLAFAAAFVVALCAARTARADGARAAPALPPEYLTHEGSWLRIAFHPSARERLRPALGRLDRAKDELVRLVGDSVPSAIDVRVGAVLGEAERIAPAALPRGSRAAAFADQRLVVVFLEGRTGQEVERDIRGALASLALSNALGTAKLSRTLEVGFVQSFAGHEPGLLTLAGATWRRELLPLADLEQSLSPRPAFAEDDSLAVAQATDLVKPLVSTRGASSAFAVLVERMRAGDAEARALEVATGGAADDLASSQRRRLARDLAFAPVLAGVLLLALGLRVARAAWRRHVDRRDADRDRRDKPRRRRAIRRISDLPLGPRVRSREGVPKVEHGGRWHTLH